MGRSRLQDGRNLWRTSPVNTQNLTEIGDRHVLGDIEADDAPESTKTEEPEVESDARDQAQHGSDGHL